MQTLQTLQTQYKNGAKPEQILNQVFDSIQKDQESASPLNAFLSLSPELAKEQAKNYDPALPLAGIPIAIKDNIQVKNTLTTCGSKLLANYQSIYDATVITRLKAAGALIVGKTNMDEFAMGSSNENSAFGPVLNPHDRTRVPGGSSGGSASAVGAGLVPLALGSDTGGSIRQPAAFCGIVGMKPTYGRVSRYGLVAFGSSLDQIGPMANCVEDAALLYSVMAGHDPLDSTSLNKPLDFQVSDIKTPIKGLKIGLPQEYFAAGLSAETRAALEKTIEILKTQGAEFLEVSLPHTEYAVPVYYVIALAEASSNLARFDGIRYGVRKEATKLIDIYTKTRTQGFGEEVKRRIMVGSYVLSSGYYDAYYLSAQKVRTLIREDFAKAFAQVDALLTPTAPTTAFKIGEKTSDPVEMYLSDIYTISANLAGIPGLSLPVGKDSQGLPMGAQLMTNLLDEKTLFQVAYAIENGVK